MVDDTSADMSSDENDNSMAWFTNISHATDEQPINVLREFRQCPQDMSRLRPRMELHRQRSSNLGKTLESQDLSFFDLEPYFCGSSPHPAPIADGTKWQGSLKDEHSYPVSPPDSAVVAPLDPWPSTEYSVAYPPNILTNMDSASARTQYGQVTPPDDGSPHSAEYEAIELQQELPQKKKRAAARSRKKPARSVAADSQEIDPNDPKYVKRSKFLERNRLAASKCRQKKKSWVDNLESRARELLSRNKALNMELASLRCEVQHVRLELAKHRNCDDSEIQEIMMQDGEYFAEVIQTLEQFERENKPDISGPRSPNNHMEELSRQYDIDPEDTLVDDHSSPPTLVPDDMFATLLRSDSVENTPSEGEGAV